MFHVKRSSTRTPRRSLPGSRWNANASHGCPGPPRSRAARSSRGARGRRGEAGRAHADEAARRADGAGRQDVEGPGVAIGNESGNLAFTTRAVKREAATASSRNAHFFRTESTSVPSRSRRTRRSGSAGKPPPEPRSRRRSAPRRAAEGRERRRARRKGGRPARGLGAAARLETRFTSAFLSRRNARKASRAAQAPPPPRRRPGRERATVARDGLAATACQAASTRPRAVADEEPREQERRRGRRDARDARRPGRAWTAGGARASRRPRARGPGARGKRSPAGSAAPRAREPGDGLALSRRGSPRTGAPGHARPAPRRRARRDPADALGPIRGQERPERRGSTSGRLEEPGAASSPRPRRRPAPRAARAWRGPA